MSKLKTSCQGCIFNDEDCALKFQQFFEDDTKFIDGFCRYKRPYKWLEAANSASTPSIKAKIINEEGKISLIVLCPDNDLSKVKETLFLMPYFIQQIILLLYTKDKVIIKQSQELIASYKLPWVVIGDYNEEYNKYVAVDQAVSCVKNHWFYVIDAGDDLPFDMLSAVHDDITNDLSRLVLYYHDQADDIHILGNRFAFMDMCGNWGLSWFDKLKEFDNWKDVCVQIAK